MKTIKTLVLIAIFQFSSGAFAQTNHVFHFNTANQEESLYVLEYDTITVINDYQVGDFHYGYLGVSQNSFNVQLGEVICKYPVIFVDTAYAFYVSYGSNPGVFFSVVLLKQYLDVATNSPDAKFSIHPNPTKDFVHIDSDNFESVRIFNLSGKLVLEDDSKSKKNDISQLSSGSYLIQIDSETQRFVIE